MINNTTFLNQVIFYSTIFGSPETVENCLLIKTDNKFLNIRILLPFIAKIQKQNTEIDKIIFNTLPNDLKDFANSYIDVEKRLNNSKYIEKKDFENFQKMESHLNYLIESEKILPDVPSIQLRDDTPNNIRNFSILKHYYPAETFLLFPNPTFSIIKSNFFDKVSFRSSKFLGGLIITNSDFNNTLDLSGAILNDSSIWLNKDFGLSFINVKSFLVYWNQVPRISEWINNKEYFNNELLIENGYKFLKRFGNDIKSNASLIDLNKYQIDLIDSWYIQKSKNDNILVKYLRKILLYFFWLFSEYGTNYYKIFFSTATIIFIFSIIYFIFGKFEISFSNNGKDIVGFKYFPTPNSYINKNEKVYDINRPINRFISCLKISTAMMLKFGSNNVRFNNSKIWFIKSIMYIQWALGFIMLILLFYTLKNTTPILIDLFQDIK